VMREMSRFYAGGAAPEERTSLMTPGR
jgi:hypothetical protein